MAPKTVYASAFLGVLLTAFCLFACDPQEQNTIRNLQDLYDQVISTTPEQAIVWFKRSHHSFVINDQQSQNLRTYKNLQQEIAKRIPREYDRPIIELKVFFRQKQNTSAPNREIGILGGIGPLSDANIMERLGERLSPLPQRHGSMLHLLSMPPPRTVWDQMLGGFLYLRHLYRFTSQNYQFFFLASNTAHLHYGKFSYLTDAQTFHLPQAVVDKLVQEQDLKSVRVLVLDTNKASSAGLYQGLLKQNDINYRLLAPPERQELDQWIEKVKSGPISKQDRHQFYLFVAALSARHQINTIILACTEIPLALSAYIPKLVENGIHVMDSESILVEAITSYLKEPE
ncbi:MAG: aspartate/glutamate racemase family protein [Oligoflexales bacterium]|nr:aspartate/glutamate racemase family protein [Oligoflexales bacterium]